MLQSFRVSNYKSIFDEQELHLRPVLPDSDFDPLTVTAIYGANASGKSNFLEALRWATDIVNGRPSAFARDESPLRVPFKLSAEGLTSPSVAEFGFEINGTEYNYGFAVEEERFLEEWLYSFPNRRKRVLFEREQGTTKIGQTVDGHREIAAFARRVRPDRSVFSVLSDIEIPQWEPVTHWFWGLRSFRRAAVPSARRAFLDRAFERHPILIDLARKADLGIRDIEITEQIIEPSRSDELQADSLERRIADLRGIAESDGETTWVDDEISRLQDRIERLRHPRVVREPVFIHNDSKIPLSLSEQSDGTIAFIGYMGRLVRLLDEGGVMVVDEIETSIHPRLLVRIIELFRDREVNPKGAQLIFTTHDTSLLGTSLGEQILRRDEIWFVEKDEHGTSRLAPMSDFKPRKGENQERRYLGGAYGAVPDVDTGSLLDIFKEHREKATAGEVP